MLFNELVMHVFKWYSHSLHLFLPTPQLTHVSDIFFCLKVAFATYHSFSLIWRFAMHFLMECHLFQWVWPLIWASQVILDTLSQKWWKLMIEMSDCILKRCSTPITDKSFMHLQTRKLYIYRVVQKMAQFLISCKFQSGLHSRVKLYTRLE